VAICLLSPLTNTLITVSKSVYWTADVYFPNLIDLLKDEWDKTQTGLLVYI